MYQPVLFFFVLLLLTSCGDEDVLDQTNSVCGEQVTIDEQRYQKDSTSLFTIVSATIVEDCLNISYTASGCSGDNWTVDLLASDAIAESLPEQRYLKLNLGNPEECLAIFTRDISFDISSLQIQNDGELLLNLDGYEEIISYKY